MSEVALIFSIFFVFSFLICVYFMAFWAIVQVAKVFFGEDEDNAK